MRIKQTIIYSNFSKIKKQKNAPNLFIRKLWRCLGEFKNISCGVFRAERVNVCLVMESGRFLHVLMGNEDVIHKARIGP